MTSVSRSIALEQTYVHDVYEKYYDDAYCKPWPKIQEFLDELEPGAVICDIGCGNGKYLKVNTSIYNLGGEKSIRLSELARQKKNEIIKLDNLALPFRDNCLDAVLSISVVHHLATTERRVCALRELARVLRVGGKMVITVWAMEQPHRNFESQDILLPWRKPMHIGTTSEIPLIEDYADDDEDCMYGTCAHTYLSTSDYESNKSFRFSDKFRGKTKTNQNNKNHNTNIGRKSSSGGSSSLSSPNETCYSFVRKALQKIAGGGKRMVAQTPWFLEHWIACTHKQNLPKKHDAVGCEYCENRGYDNVENQPIELLRIDDEEPKDIPRRQTFSASDIKNDINTFKSKSMSHISADSGREINNEIKPIEEIAKIPAESHPIIVSTKPKLVKQKQSICDEYEALDQPTDITNLIKILPNYKTSTDRGSVLKQWSLNEEYLSSDRLKEKEKLKQNIQKQTSLNEELIYKRTYTFESLKDSIFSVATSRKFQMLKTGLTNKFKNSTINMEKVTGTSLKNGFAKMIQMISPTTPHNRDIVLETIKKHRKQSADEIREHIMVERRQSGSDSSKDGSLQSDTSVDSEDSFASVIFVPKSDPMSPLGGVPPASPLVVKNSCQPSSSSTRIKQSSCPTSPRVKNESLVGGVALTKQLSSPKPTTEHIGTTAFFPTIDKETDSATHLLPVLQISKPLAQNKYYVPQIPEFRKTNLNTPSSKDNIPVPSHKKPITQQRNNSINLAISTPDHCTTTNGASKNEKLKKIREMLMQKPDFRKKTLRNNSFPIVRKNAVPDGKPATIAKSIPKLLTLDIYNPEEDDDSDSSCVSSPDSTDTVVSKQPLCKKSSLSPPYDTKKKTFYFPDIKNRSEAKPMSLLEAAANVAGSLDEAVEKVIKSTTAKSKRLLSQRRFSSDTVSLLDTNDEQIEHYELQRCNSTWNEECQKHLTTFADKLSEKLRKEINDYKLAMGNIEIDDPYIQRLSDELQDLSHLSAEIHKQNQYLAKHQQQKHGNKLKTTCPRCKLFSNCSCRTSRNRTKYKRTHSEGEGERLIEDNEEETISNDNLFINRCNSMKNNYCVNNSDNLYSVNNHLVLNTNNNERRHLDDNNLECTISSTSNSDRDQRPIKRKEEIYNLEEIPSKISTIRTSTESYDSFDRASSSSSTASSNATSINLQKRSTESSSISDDDSKLKYSSNEGSTASLISLEYKNKNRLDVNGDSNNSNSSRLSPSRRMKQRDPSELSDFSQDSLPSDEIGGEIIYHRYYHVFRKGELDQLINKYVDNLHIVSSTYEHSSWRIVAEKVQIWTI